MSDACNKVTLYKIKQHNPGGMDFGVNCHNYKKNTIKICVYGNSDSLLKFQILTTNVNGAFNRKTCVTHSSGSQMTLYGMNRRRNWQVLIPRYDAPAQ